MPYSPGVLVSGAAAILLLLLAGVPAGGQVLPQPTSSVPLPTSSVAQPIDEPIPLETLAYPYAERDLDPAAARIFALAAGLMLIAGIVLLGGTLERTLGLNRKSW